jgi:hypothetical protein
MNEREALKLALEALEIEEAQTHYPSQWLLRAIAAAKEALAQPAPKYEIFMDIPHRKPLTWERVLEIGIECANDRSRLPFEVKVARAVEAAHEIK